MRDAFRRIVHVDMDAFYASVEQRDNPGLRGKPVIVGGNPASRGVVCTCSYEARKFGIHSAMPSAQAFRLCPQGVFIHPRMDVYQFESSRIREIFYEYTDLVEPLSLDEAYLDVTSNKKNIPSGTIIATMILEQIRSRTRLTASAGVSFNKFLAKVASDINKPNGLKVITPAEAAAFIDTLPIARFHGIGKVTAEKMRRMGIHTGADLKKLSLAEIAATFGKPGVYFHEIAHGCDRRNVEPVWERRSVGREHTLQSDISERAAILAVLAETADEVQDALRELKLKGKTLTLKLKYDDFQSITRSKTLNTHVSSSAELMRHVPALLDKTEAGRRKVRLLGLSVSNFPDEHGPWQPELPF